LRVFYIHPYVTAKILADILTILHYIKTHEELQLYSTFQE